MVVVIVVVTVLVLVLICNRKHCVSLLVAENDNLKGGDGMRDQMQSSNKNLIT